MTDLSKVRAALRFYADYVASCTATGAYDDGPRQALAADCGYRARNALEALSRLEQPGGRGMAEDVGNLLAVWRLASELCDAVDAAESDVGGHRKMRTILGELGPAVDAAKSAAAALRAAYPESPDAP